MLATPGTLTGLGLPKGEHRCWSSGSAFGFNAENACGTEVPDLFQVVELTLDIEAVEAFFVVLPGLLQDREMMPKASRWPRVYTYLEFSGVDVSSKLIEASAPVTLVLCKH